MILAATHPDLMGPVVIAGAPLSYWAGEQGRNPLRYYRRASLAARCRRYWHPISAAAASTARTLC